LSQLLDGVDVAEPISRKFNDIVMRYPDPLPEHLREFKIPENMLGKLTQQRQPEADERMHFSAKFF